MPHKNDKGIRLVIPKLRNAKKRQFFSICQVAKEQEKRVGQKRHSL